MKARTSPTDDELLARWRAGDDHSGHALFARYFDVIHRFFKHRCAAEADDLAQATLAACLRAKHRFRGDASFRTYVFTIARHELHRVLRVRRREGDHDRCEPTWIIDPAPTPAARLGHHEDHRRLVEVMRQVPVEYRTLLELHYWDDLEIAELAARFGAPMVTIRSRLHRGRALVRQLLDDDASLERADRGARDRARQATAATRSGEHQR